MDKFKPETHIHGATEFMKDKLILIEIKTHGN